MERVLRPLLLALTATLTLAACGEDSSSTATPAEPQTGRVDVGMNRLKFEPDSITVKTGATVVWTNKENVPHDVVAEEGADFASDQFGEGGTFEWTAKAPGTVKYVCTLHPGMDGTITVVG